MFPPRPEKCRKAVTSGRSPPPRDPTRAGHFLAARPGRRGVRSARTASRSIGRRSRSRSNWPMAARLVSGEVLLIGAVTAGGPVRARCSGRPASRRRRSTLEAACAINSHSVRPANSHALPSGSRCWARGSPQFKPQVVGVHLRGVQYHLRNSRVAGWVGHDGHSIRGFQSTVAGWRIAPLIRPPRPPEQEHPDQMTTAASIPAKMYSSVSPTPMAR